METFVKLRPLARVSYVGLKLAEGAEGKVHHQNFAYEVKIDKGETKDGLSSTIETNQSFDLAVGALTPKKYPVMVYVHPALQMAAQGVSSFMLEPGEEIDLTLTFKALRKIDLTKLPYTVRLYVIG